MPDRRDPQAGRTVRPEAAMAVTPAHSAVLPTLRKKRDEVFVESEG